MCFLSLDIKKWWSIFNLKAFSDIETIYKLSVSVCPTIWEGTVYTENYRLLNKYECVYDYKNKTS